MASIAVPSVAEEVRASRKRTLDVFFATNQLQLPEYLPAAKVRVAARVLDDYRRVALQEPVAPAQARARALSSSAPAAAMLTAGSAPLLLTDVAASSRPSAAAGPMGVAAAPPVPPAAAGGAGAAAASTALALTSTSAAVQDVLSAITARTAARGVSLDSESQEALRRAEELAERAQASSRAIVERRTAKKIPEPKWHAPWKLMRVISGHMGWVRSVAVDPSNEWFVTGAADRNIKVWDLASGTLKLTLTGHINTVRGLAVSPRHPYLFSAGEDKQVKCWDLEYNKVIRHYHGHLSGVYSLALHPTLDILMTGGRDSVCRVWDMRTKSQIHTLGGHENSVSAILANSVDPQVITGSMDSTIRLWDLAAGRVRTVLTHHKKAVRGMCGHPKEFAFVSGAADNLKKWALPAGELVSNFSGHNSIINTVSVNADDVLVSGGDDGSIRFWDYNTGYCFQELQSRVQPGSLDSEAAIYASTFDHTGLRLITCEADKSIKIWREDAEATPESHPIDMAAWTEHCKQHRRY